MTKPSVTDTAAVSQMFGPVGQHNGIEVWRIEKLKPIRVEPSAFGSFHTGDCYIVLKTWSKPNAPNKRNWDLHFWQGAHCSIDERGASAIRSVELDDLLEGAPVQYREVQGHESPQFLSLFHSGIRYLDGGVETAFRHVDAAAYTPKLYQLKGRRTIRSKQVELSASSLNDGDVFLLDAGLTLYQWNGASASRAEKFKALELATKIDGDERGGKAQIVVIESGDKGPEADAFWKLLKGNQSQVKPASAGGDDDAAAAHDVPTLWRISDDGSAGAPTMSEVARGKLTREMLEESNAMLLDAGGSITVWIGRGASKDERSKAMSYAAQYQATHNRPTQAPIMRLPSGGETPEFKSFFAGFDRLAPSSGSSSSSSSSGGDEAVKERQLEMSALLAKRTAAVQSMLDDAHGSVQVWRIENLQRVAIDAAHFGQFYSGDSFIVLYKYRTKSGKESFVLYFWQGRESSTDEKGASALLTVEMAKELNGLPGTQVRVVQNKEPLHFLALFKGKMVVRSGGVAAHGGFNHGAGSSSGSSDVAQLFHIRGTNAIDTRAVQVPAVATSLNSSDCFVLLTPGTAFEWRGRGSNASERATADSLSRVVLSAGRKEIDVEEGSEPAEFWTALGGQAAYPSAKHLSDPTVEPRLFEVTASAAAGKIVAEEIVDFAQSDLDQSNVYILDTGAEVAVWVGARAPQIEKDAAVEMARQFVSSATNGRSASTPIFRVPAGAEPPTFTAAFLGWNEALANDWTDPYERKINALKAGAAAGASSSSSASAAAPAAAVERVDASSASSSASSSAAAAGKTFTLAELKSGVPAGVEASRKECYLSDSDFKSALGMDRDAFAKTAGWKQAELKKKAGIF